MEKKNILMSVAAVVCLLVFSAFSLLNLSPSQNPHNESTPSSVASVSTQHIDSVQSANGITNQVANESLLRILYTKHASSNFGISDQEHNLIKKFAAQQGLNLAWQEYDEPWELLPALYQNEGDIILSQNHDLGGGLKGVIDYTVPWSTRTVQIISYDNDIELNELSELAGRQIVVTRSQIQPGLFESLTVLKENNEIKVLDDDTEVEQILAKLSTGEYDLAILDSDSISNNHKNFPKTKTIYTFANEIEKVWAIKKDNLSLKKDLNTFLISELFLSNHNKNQPRDLASIKASGVLRVISYLSPTNMYYQDGELNGFEYDFLKSFAEENKIDLAIVFAKSHDELFKLLETGTGDIVAASVNELQDNAPLLSKSIPYAYSAPMLISRENESNYIDVSDLEGKTISLSAESQYFDYLNNLKQKYDVSFNIEVVDESINTEALLFMISLGIKDLTIIPSNNVVAELSRQINLKAGLQLDQPSALVWYTRSKNNQLLSEINDFIAKEYRKLRYNELKRKYVSSPKKIKGDEKLLTKVFNLTPYDNYIKKYSDQHGFDWRLIAAQIYQESQFDPEAISYVGAQGLMQIMPGTADELGLDATEDPNENIEAGVRYLAILRDRFGDEISVVDQLWFALAAYNAGYNRVERARKLADSMGLDKDKWFKNVEVAMKGLSNHRKEDNTAYCRCGQTVVYVRNIRTRYENYIAVSNRASTTVFVDNVITELRNYN